MRVVCVYVRSDKKNIIYIFFSQSGKIITSSVEIRFENSLKLRCESSLVRFADINNILNLQRIRNAFEMKTPKSYFRYVKFNEIQIDSPPLAFSTNFPLVLQVN